MAEFQARSILESITDGLVVLDREWRYVYANQRAADLIGRARGDLVGRCIWDVIPDGRATLLHAYAERAVAEGTAVRVEEFYPRLQKWLEEDLTPSPEGLTINVRDITARKRLEMLQAAQHAVTRILAEATTVEQSAADIFETICRSLHWSTGALWCADPDAGVLRALQVFGGGVPSLREFVEASRALTFAPGVGLPGRVWRSGKPAWIPDLAADRDIVRAPLALRAGLRAALAFPILLGGQPIGVVEFFAPEIAPPDEAVLSVVEGVGGQIGQFIERKKAEDERARLLAREQAARAEAEAAQQRSAFLAEASALLGASLDYQATLRSIARLVVPYLADWCAVDMVDEAGAPRHLTIAHSDPEREALASAMLRRYPTDPAGPHPVMRVLKTGAPEVLAELPDEVLVAIARGPEHLAFLRSLGMGSALVLPLLARDRILGAITLVMAESGRRYHAADLVLADDLARRAALALDNARLYKELMDADRRKDQFLAMLAHELRNPLAPVQSAMDVLRRQGAGDPTVERAREVTERQVRHLARLLDDLLDVARITQSRVELRKAPVDLATVVTEAVESARGLLESRGHALEVTLPDPPLALEADPTRLTQVLANLLNNAARYTGPGGRVAVAAGREGDEAVVRVADTGIGIAPGMLHRIFDLFAQANPSLARSEGGLGVGLTLARKLVELHGGTVTAHSEGPGRGSVFVVRLPVGRPLAPAAGAPVTRSGPVRRILVVEDNADARDMLRLALELDGHEVAAAADGLAALELAEALRPDVALVDIGLPGIDGYEVARRLRASPGRRPRLIALTGYGQRDDRDRARAAGFDAHLVKPVDPDSLTRALEGAGTEEP